LNPYELYALMMHVQRSNRSNNVMFPLISPYTVKLLHEDKLRDAAKRYRQLELIRNATEQPLDEYQNGLIRQMTRWLHGKSTVQTQSQDCNDGRPAHAI